MAAEDTLAAASALAAAAYGSGLAQHWALALRALVRTAALGALAVCAYVSGAPAPLIAGLVLSAVGDACLAVESPAWRRPALGAFVAAAVCYGWLFAEVGGGRPVLAAEPARILGVLAAAAAGIAIAAQAWPVFKQAHAAIGVATAAVCGMAAASFTLPLRMWPAILAGGVFVSAYALAMAVPFRSSESNGLSRLGWALYYAGQALTTWAFLR